MRHVRDDKPVGSCSLCHGLVVDRTYHGGNYFDSERACVECGATAISPHGPTIAMGEPRDPVPRRYHLVREVCDGALFYVKAEGTLAECREYIEERTSILRHDPPDRITFR